MNPNVRWKLILIVVVVALSIFSFYPPSQKVNLGLDLKGGVHLVLRVQTDDALRLETETTVERLRDTLTRGGIQFSKLEMTDPQDVRRRGHPERPRRTGRRRWTPTRSTTGPPGWAATPTR